MSEVSYIAREATRIKVAMAWSTKTGLCAIYRQVPAWKIREGVYSNTCQRIQCIRAWIFKEPWRCPTCKSLEFWRVMTDLERKIFYCRQCNRDYSIRGRAIMEVVGHEALEDEGEE